MTATEHNLATAPQALCLLLVDDEPLAREKVRALLNDEPGIAEIHECRSAREALEVIPTVKPNIIFLDVQMPGLNGFDMLHALHAMDIEEGYTPLVIFVTAYQQYALDAFSVNAIDYLLKPFDRKRFREAFTRAKQHLEAREAQKHNAHLASILVSLQQTTSQQAEANSHQFLENLVAKVRGKVTVIPIHHVCWMESEGNYINVHTTEGSSYLVRETISGVEAKLNPRDFMRIHRTVIVANRFVKNFTTSGTNDFDCIILRDGTELPLSRSYRDNVLRLLS